MGINISEINYRLQAKNGNYKMLILTFLDLMNDRKITYMIVDSIFQDTCSCPKMVVACKNAWALTDLRGAMPQ